MYSNSNIHDNVVPFESKSIPKVLSLIIHIYNNQKLLNLQINCWKNWGLIPGLELIFLDDGSNPELDLSAIPRWVRKIRIIDDIPWNQPGAKNLAATLATGSWLLFLDADQLLDRGKILQLFSQLPNLNENKIYRFKRFCATSHRELIVHQNCQLIASNTFRNFGGYDEDFAGNYGHEDAYFERLWRFKGGEIVTLDQPWLIDYSNLETKGLSRNGRINELLRRRKMRYWHLNKTFFGRFMLLNPLIFQLFLKFKVIADGRTTNKIRFNWKEV